MIPYGRQDIREEDIEAVVDVLRSDWLTQGPVVPHFEAAIASRCGVEEAVAVANATAALHLACRALGLGQGDILWTSPNTFVASANCALYCGASVDFVDIDPMTFNMSVTALKSKLELAERQRKLPKVVVPVHFAGQSCPMLEIRELADQYGFSVIEDASHAIGADYRDAPVGSCRYADIAVFSFHPVKIITTGEGGMAVTNDRQLAERMRLLRSHGITRDAAVMECSPDGPWYYEQLDLGYNYRMTDIQAALGISQMERLSQFVARRTFLASRYNSELAGLPLVHQESHGDVRSAWHLYVVRVKSGCTSRTALFTWLRENGIGVNLHYIPVYRQPYFRRMGFVPGDFPETEAYYGEAFSLPLYPGLTEEMQDQVVDLLKDGLKES